MTNNQIAYWTLQENKRANLAKEQELHRSNLQNEKIKGEGNRNTLQIGLGTISENARSNRVKEKENARSNRENERIKDYVNFLSEKRIPIEWENAKSNAFNAQANMSNAATRNAELLETNRSNLEQERLKDEFQAEQRRANKESENLQRFRDSTNAAAGLSQAGSRSAQVGETIRHNIVSEQIDTARARSQALTNAAKAANEGLSTLSQVQGQQIRNAGEFFKISKGGYNR